MIKYCPLMARFYVSEYCEKTSLLAIALVRSTNIANNPIPKGQTPPPPNKKNPPTQCLVLSPPLLPKLLERKKKLPTYRFLAGTDPAPKPGATVAKTVVVDAGWVTVTVVVGPVVTVTVEVTVDWNGNAGA